MGTTNEGKKATDAQVQFGNEGTQNPPQQSPRQGNEPAQRGQSMQNSEVGQPRGQDPQTAQGPDAKEVRGYDRGEDEQGAGLGQATGRSTVNAQGARTTSQGGDSQQGVKSYGAEQGKAFNPQQTKQAATGTSGGQYNDFSKIKDQMKVYCLDGTVCGNIDHIESGNKSIKLTRDRNGQHHWISMDLVASVDTDGVHLSQSLDQLQKQWKETPPTSMSM